MKHSAHEVEEWRLSPSYPDYEASSTGRVRRATAGHVTFIGRIISQRKNQRGYWRLSVRVNRKSVSLYAHTVIADAFIGVRPPGHSVNHIDGNKDRNVPANLEYVTVARNSELSWETGLSRWRGQDNGAAKLTSNDVISIRQAFSGGETHKALAARFGVGHTTIGNIIRGVSWKCLGIQSISKTPRQFLNTPKGESSAHAKLTSAQAAEIFLADRSVSCARLAGRYGVHKDTVKLIRRRKTWRSVTDCLEAPCVPLAAVARAQKLQKSA